MLASPSPHPPLRTRGEQSGVETGTIIVVGEVKKVVVTPAAPELKFYEKDYFKWIMIGGGGALVMIVIASMCCSKHHQKKRKRKRDR